MLRSKIRLNTGYVPHAPLGQTENHYGIPFTVTDSGEVDASEKPILVLLTDLPADEAKVMADVGRVTVLESYDDAAEKATAEKKVADEKAAAEKK